MERDNRPIDVKIAEGGKKLKIIEMGAGGVVYLFNPTLGLSIFLVEGAQWLGANQYVKWRMKGKQQVPQAA